MSAYLIEPHENVDRWLRRSLVVGIAAAAVSLIGALYAPDQFFRIYLFAYVFLLGFPLGGLALVMIHHLTGGAWGLLVRRIFEAQMRTLPLVALFFIPIAVGLSHIYPWADGLGDTGAAPQGWYSRYLEPGNFYWRAVGYFAVWLLLGLTLARWSRRQDESGDARLSWKCYKLSGFGLVIFGVALHFAATDWIMSLEPKFTSTIFGPLVFSGQILTAFAASVAVFSQLAGRTEYQGICSTKAINDLGSLMFTLLVLWAYMVWFQFMLVWIADLPRDTAWYHVRINDGWNWLLLALVLFHFVVPFFLLLFRNVKRQPHWLGWIAGLILFTQLLFDYYQVMPTFQAGGAAVRWIDVTVPIALVGLWLAVFLWQLERHPLLPRCDLNYRQARHLRELEEEEASREEALAHA